MNKLRSLTLAASGLLLAASCGGEAFTNDPASAGSGAGGASAGSAGAEPLSGGSAGTESSSGGAAAASGASAGGEGGAAGEQGVAGEGGAAGEAGAGPVEHGDCAELGGSELGGHCYIDATVATSTQPQAVAACSALALQLGASGQLLVLDSPQEQAFILERFLVQFTDVSDAWLGLGCGALEHPSIGDCYCTGCDKATLLSKQQAWRWLDQSSSTFGWVNGNPNGAFRCAALGYNPMNTIWGWVDRPCDVSVISPIAEHEHDYRTICELEL